MTILTLTIASWKLLIQIRPTGAAARGGPGRCLQPAAATAGAGHRRSPHPRRRAGPMAAPGRRGVPLNPDAGRPNTLYSGWGEQCNKSVMLWVLLFGIFLKTLHLLFGLLRLPGTFAFLILSAVIRERCSSIVPLFVPCWDKCPAPPTSTRPGNYLLRLLTKLDNGYIIFRKSI